jgi:hypothetical protein
MSKEWFTSINEEKDRGENVNVVDGLFEISRALYSVSRALRDLGNAGAATPMGGMEALGKVVSESIDGMGRGLAEAIRESLSSMEGAINVELTNPPNSQE